MSAPRERRRYSDCRRERRNAAIDYIASWIHVSRRPRLQVELTNVESGHDPEIEIVIDDEPRKKSDQRIEIRLTGRQSVLSNLTRCPFPRVLAGFRSSAHQSSHRRSFFFAGKLRCETRLVAL